MHIHHRARALVGAAALGATVLTGCAALGGSPAGPRGQRPWARAELRTATGTTIGTVAFVDDPLGHHTEILVRLNDAPGTPVSAFHGMHIHANDTPANGDGCLADAAQPSSTWFVSVDGHWKHDPGEVHAGHAGDLPSVYLNADGSAQVSYSVDKLTPEELAGRAVVLHAGPDNFANVPTGTAPDQYVAGPTALAKTQATGNAGDRYACGVITR